MTFEARYTENTHMQFPKSKLEAVLRFAHESEYSDFYRNRFSRNVVKESLTKARWETIPFVTKDEIQRTPFWDRVFTPARDVHVIRQTYGSSGKKSLIVPRFYFGNFDDPYKVLGMTRLMSFFSSGLNEFPRNVLGGQVWFGDVTHLSITAKIAAKARINSMYILPYTAISFAEYLKREGAIDNIRALQITGERCSPLQYRKIKALYPNAVIFGNYASSETRECVALACKHSRANGQGMILEGVPEYYIEIIDAQTHEPVETPGAHGELVITATEAVTPFPMIRYRTGDIATYVPRACACEFQRRGFEVLGRASVLPVRMTRGEITVDNIEEVLLGIGGVYSDYFEVHYREEAGEGRALPRITLRLFPLERHLDKREIALHAMSRLKVFHGYTYENGVEEGFYLPLTVEFLENVPQGRPGKPKAPIVVRHVAGSREKRHVRAFVH